MLCRVLLLGVVLSVLRQSFTAPFLAAPLPRLPRNQPPDVAGRTVGSGQDGAAQMSVIRGGGGGRFEWGYLSARAPRRGPWAPLGDDGPQSLVASQYAFARGRQAKGRALLGERVIQVCRLGEVLGIEVLVLVLAVVVPGEFVALAVVVVEFTHA